MKKLLLAILTCSCVTMAFAAKQGLSSAQTVCEGVTAGSVYQIQRKATEKEILDNCLNAEVIETRKGNDIMTATTSTGEEKMKLYMGGKGDNATFKSAVMY